jgi:hypothetical protein
LVQACLADHNQFGHAVPVKRLVEIAVHAGANGLQCHAHRFIYDGDEPLKAQDIMGADYIGDLGLERGRIGDIAAGHDKALELVMAVFMCVIVVMVVVVIMMVIIVVVMVMHLVTGL